MKLKCHLVNSDPLFLARRAGRFLACAILGLATLGSLGGAEPNRDGFTAHEWGTFTSVQGGDGALLTWRPLESSRLPKFVYDWNHPGLNRQGTSLLVLGKGGISTLQRMETPVIYFYANAPQTVDVSVGFPKGLITEWFPQAPQIGPSSSPSPSILDCSGALETKLEFMPMDGGNGSSVKESRATWGHVKILASKQDRVLPDSLPFDRSGSHYFAARDTDANYLEVDSLSATNSGPEHEKFIFYRGVGSFATPLRVMMTADNLVTVTNTGSEPLAHLFVLRIENKAGKFVRIERLSPGQESTVDLGSADKVAPIGEVSRQLGESMAESLVQAGLYLREATAMVKTWTDSWFEEDGVRVFYVLPRAWTDRTLPLTMQPTPRELVRVMIGRAEILSPAREQRLSESLVKAQQGDAEARAEAIRGLKEFGRFAEPALQLAIKDADTQVTLAAWKLYQTTTQVPGKPL